MRWINKLSNEELLELHRYAVCPDTNSIDDLYIDEEDGCIDIDFNENWPYEDGTPSYVPTNYRYYDFDYENYDTGGEPTNGAYRTWMVKRFGKEYINDMLHRKLGVDIEFLKRERAAFPFL